MWCWRLIPGNQEARARSGGNPVAVWIKSEISVLPPAASGKYFRVHVDLHAACKLFCISSCTNKFVHAACIGDDSILETREIEYVSWTNVSPVVDEAQKHDSVD